MSEYFTIILAIIFAILVLVYVFPDTMEKWYKRITTTKEIVIGIGGFAVSVVLIGSGNLYFVALGGASLIYGVLWLVFDRPHEAVKSYVN